MLFGVETPSAAELTGWRKYFNSYTTQGRRNYVLATYGILVVSAAAFLMHRQNREEKQTSASTA
uniref:Up-regulated during skeletal muscle growth protein 5 n=1 Tax=Acanthochromis polyacanthus TaxID=80966 RepID=A0A3Q1FU31_9TELE